VEARRKRATDGHGHVFGRPWTALHRPWEEEARLGNGRASLGGAHLAFN